MCLALPILYLLLELMWGMLITPHVSIAWTYVRDVDFLPYATVACTSVSVAWAYVRNADYAACV